MTPDSVVLTYRFRVKDRSATELNRQARSVNAVWNFCNETQKHALRWDKKWPSGFDLQRLSAGASKDLGLQAHTVQRVCQEYEKARTCQRKRMLRWRGAGSLGWVPFSTGCVSFHHGAFWFRRQRYDVWLSRDLPERIDIRAGSFSQDSKGRWYLNATVRVPISERSAGVSAIGIDLGLKDLAVTSSGDRIEAQRFYRGLEPALATAQRARKPTRVRAIHAKVANRRIDHLHKLSTRLVQENAAIFVGNVSAAGPAKTTMAKSVYDAGWSLFRQQLAYKAIRQRVLLDVVSEAWTTQTCSSCGALPPESPTGIAGLGIRAWTCSACGSVHDRDVNAARNILAAGLGRLAGGISARKGQRGGQSGA